MRFSVGLVGAVLVLAACGGGEESADTATSSVPATSVATTTTSSTSTTVGMTEDEANLILAEAFIDAFYSFDPAELLATLASA